MAHLAQALASIANAALWKEKDLKTMIIAAAAVMALSVGSAAYAEGEGGVTASGLQWQGRNGNARVPATEWFAANAALRQQLSHQYAGATYLVHSENGHG